MDGEIAATHGRQDHRPARQRARRPRRVRRLRRPDQVPGRPVPHLLRLLRHSRAYLPASTGVYTNKAPGGVAYRCSLPRHRGGVPDRAHGRRAGAEAGHGQGRDPRQELHQGGAVPLHHGASAWSTTRGDYHTALDKVLDAVDYKALRAEQAAKRADPERPTLMGIGLATFTEVVGAGPSKMCDILGIGMFDSCEIRVHPTGSAIARMGTITQGQGHQTTYAQIIATELGIPADVIQVEEGDTDTAPYGLGTYGSRSTPVAGAAIAHGGAQDPREGEEDRRAPARSAARTTSNGRSTASRSRAIPSQLKTMKDIAWAAYNNVPRRHGAGPGSGALLRPAELHLPVRHLPLRGRHRRRHRRDQGAPLLRAGRLRHAHQPDDHRGPDPRRPDRRLRRRDGPADAVRRAGQLHRQHR